MKIDLQLVRDIVYGDGQLVWDASTQRGIAECYDFLKRFSGDKVIYGINTGFGPMAQWRVDDDHLRDLQYNIIRSHATGAGCALEDRFVRAAMIARVGSFAQQKSGVHPELVNLLTEFINRGICPYIPMHGSVGASGDLVQLAHIALCLIGEGKVHYRGEWRETRDVLAECGLKPMDIHIREGLSCTNGTSVMTGISAINQLDAERLLEWATLAAVWMNEIAGSYDDLMSAPLNESRRHKGQIAIAEQMRELSKDSKRLQKRENKLYTQSDEMHSTKVFKDKVQAYYSLRCAPQILGPIYDTLAYSRQVIEEEMNAASDNPIVDPQTENVYHGGNFHGDYISLEADKMKIAMVRLAMVSERQLNYLCHDRINGILPPFLNLGTLGLNYGIQACQFTATSTTAECQTLAMPNYVHSIPNNNDNQDIVSMGTNSAELCTQVINNCYQVLSILFIAMAQAVDCLSIKNELSSAVRKQYDAIRGITPTIIEDTPFYEDIAAVEHYLRKGQE
ncbi:MAG: aromatic amino acid ammonia-lyase [Paludibacteraceae bacterium]|nr:aromatic amino acid ammonia-lyase [Paludibacteraceae bacterium]